MGDKEQIEKDRAAVSICISIVSHSQGAILAPLLSDLLRLKGVIDEVVLTLNVAEDDRFIRDVGDLPLRVIRNSRPKGFGENHNSAFVHCKAPYFVVVNPDIRLKNFDIDHLVSAAARPNVGVVAPLVYSSDGLLQDSARRFPTLFSIFRRKLHGASSSDYRIAKEPMTVDWVAGMLMLFKADVYRQLGGFDDQYFMYFEDVDLCKRLQLAGLQVVLCTNTMVVHDAQRASHRKLNHFVWHCTSACRYFLKRLKGF